MSDSRNAYYLYCLTYGGRGLTTSVIGVDGQHAAFAHSYGEIGAVLSQVELGEFCGAPAELNLQDLAWLGPRVCRHEAVIEELMRQTPVLPARFATLFASLDTLQLALLEHREAITGFFSQLGDKQEWAVKGLLLRAEALAALGLSVQPAPDEQARAATPGTSYFRQKRNKAEGERDLNTRLKLFCRQAAAALGARADGFRERAVLLPVAAGTDAEVILNWAFLLSPVALDSFKAQLDRINGSEAFPGLLLTLTGPWPPFSFAPSLSSGAGA